jgi:hypothetical protein
VVSSSSLRKSGEFQKNGEYKIFRPLFPQFPTIT